MFFYPAVLRRRSGCFGTIWLAATCSARLVRREYLGVDVPRTCAAVTAFVIGRGGWEDPPPPAGAPPPRCSLYLAALLQLGLARVYGRQCRWLLEEAALVLERLHRVSPAPRIDLPGPQRPQLLRVELPPDPLFGVMAPPLPSPTALPQVQRLLEEPPPGPPLMVSPEVITLREPEPLPPPELEEELPEVTLRELELLSEVEGALGAPEEEAPPIPLPPPPPAPRPPKEPSLPPPPPEAPPRRRRRAPRLPHIDPQPQIPHELFQAQLLQPHIHCRHLILLEPPHKRRRTHGELLGNPTCGWLPPDLWGLWDRGARLPPPAPPPPPPPEVEVLREELEPSLPPLPSLELTLETTEEEPLPRLLPPPEERRAPPLPPPPELPELDDSALRRLVAAAARQPGGAELGGLVPHGASRRLVGRLFALCLELCGAGQLRLEQARPYGPISVGLGPAPFPPSPSPR